MQPSRKIDDLIAIMAALRTPETGCPWDLEQDFASIAPYTIEEAYEVVDAIERGDLLDLRDELGDLLLQVIFHARLAEEQNRFGFEDVVLAITSKLIRRHPHVFGRARDLSPGEVKALWDTIKAQEKIERAAERVASGLSAPDSNPSLLDDVPVNLPALTRAEKLQAKASKVGFDWKDARLVLQKIREETDEIEEALSRDDQSGINEEIGDLLFVLANLARHLSVNPEQALQSANKKFIRRFNYIEENLKAKNQSIETASLDQMEALWNEVRLADKKMP
jgi:nucleoside triphosphate diphosphatase